MISTRPHAQAHLRPIMTMRTVRHGGSVASLATRAVVGQVGKTHAWGCLRGQDADARSVRQTPDTRAEDGQLLRMASKASDPDDDPALRLGLCWHEVAGMRHERMRAFLQDPNVSTVRALLVLTSNCRFEAPQFGKCKLSAPKIWVWVGLISVKMKQYICCDNEDDMCTNQPLVTARCFCGSCGPSCWSWSGFGLRTYPELLHEPTRAGVWASQYLPSLRGVPSGCRLLCQPKYDNYTDEVCSCPREEAFFRRLVLHAVGRIELRHVRKLFALPWKVFTMAHCRRTVCETSAMGAGFLNTPLCSISVWLCT